MDKPEIKVKLNRQQPPVANEPSGSSNATREPSFWTQRARRSRRDRPSFFATWQEAGAKSKILMPVGLATLTGVLLGIFLLVLFKGQSEGPTVTTIPAPTGAKAASVATAAAELPESSLYAWQVGVFQERSKAEEVQKEIEGKGIPVTLRGTGPYQLFAGVALDKKANSLLEVELNKQKVAYYIKDFKIPAAKGGIAGVQDADGKRIEATLRKEAKLGEDLLQAVLTSADKARLDALQGQANTLKAEIKSVQMLLTKAGLKEEAALVDTMHSSLADAGAAALSKPVAAEGKLAAFYVRYEDLSGKLIKIQ